MAFVVKAPGGVCDSVSEPTTCDLPIGTKFDLSVEVIDPPAEGYGGMTTEIEYGGLTYNPTNFHIDEIVWPDAIAANRSPASPTGTEGSVQNLATSFAQNPPTASFHEGNLLQISLRCTESTSTTDVELVTDNASPSGSTSLNVVSGNSTVVQKPKAIETEVADRVAINCLDTVPTYTPTPAGPTPTPTFTPENPEGDPGMSLTVKSGGVCNPPEKPTVCSVLAGDSFLLVVETNDRPEDGYIAVQTRIDPDGLGYTAAATAGDEFIWTDCSFPLRSVTSVISHACATALNDPFPASTYAGNLVALQFWCLSTGSHAVGLLPHSELDPLGSAYRLVLPDGQAGEIIPMSDSLTINCVTELPATATPPPAPPATPASVGGVGAYADAGAASGNTHGLIAAAVAVVVLLSTITWRRVRR